MVSIALNYIRRDGLADRIGIGIAGLCLLHCVATLLVVASLATSLGGLFDPHLHEYGLVFAIIVGAVALCQGYFRHYLRAPAAIGTLGIVIMAIALGMPHSATEAWLTMVGVSILALGHFLNYRASR